MQDEAIHANIFLLFSQKKTKLRLYGTCSAWIYKPLLDKTTYLWIATCMALTIVHGEETWSLIVLVIYSGSCGRQADRIRAGLKFFTR